jgi:hypothetical protein
MKLRVAPQDPSPIEIEPRPCDWCGLTIDQHVMVDNGEGPEFFCQKINPHAANLVLQWELQDKRDAWRHTNRAPPPASIRNSDLAGTADKPRSYRTPQSTIDAFMWLASYRDVSELREWLRHHPKDAAFLLTLLKGKVDA